MPVKLKEKPFKPYFLGDSKEEAEKVYKSFFTDLTMLSRKAAFLSGMNREDLFQEAVIGLARAKRDFEKDRSENFRIFAIYKIKDAIREHISSQQRDVRVPQYLLDATSLIRQLTEKMKKGVTLPEYLPLSEIWRMSSDFKSEASLEEDVKKIRISLINLSDRTHTSVPELLERLDLTPTMLVDISEIDKKTLIDPEMEIINSLSSDLAIYKLKKLLSQDDFDLLYLRFVEGYTFRELADKFNISEVSLSVKVNKLVSGLKGKRGVILEDTESSNPCTYKARTAAIRR